MAKGPGFISNAIANSVKKVIQSSISKTIKNSITKAIKFTLTSTIGKLIVNVLKKAMKGIKFIFKSLFKIFKGIFGLLFGSINDNLDNQLMEAMVKSDPKIAKVLLTSNGKYLSDTVRKGITDQLDNILKESITDSSPDIIKANIKFMRAKNISGKTNLSDMLGSIKNKSTGNTFKNLLDDVVKNAKSKLNKLTTATRDTYSSLMEKTKSFTKKYKKTLIGTALGSITTVAILQDVLSKSMDKEEFNAKIINIEKDPQDPSFLYIDYELSPTSPILRWKDGDTVVISSVTGVSENIDDSYLFYSQGIKKQNQVKIKVNNPNLIIDSTKIGGNLNCFYEFYDEVNRAIRENGSDCSLQLDRDFNTSCNDNITKIRYNIVTNSTGNGVSCLDIAKQNNPTYDNWIKIDNQIVGEKTCKPIPLQEQKTFKFLMAFIVIVIIYILFKLIDRFVSLLNINKFKSYN